MLKSDGINQLYDSIFSFPSIIIISPISFHGQIIYNEPNTNPVKAASVWFLYLLSNHAIIWENPTRPAIDPRTKNVNKNPTKGRKKVQQARTIWRYYNYRTRIWHRYARISSLTFYIF